MSAVAVLSSQNYLESSSCWVVEHSTVHDELAESSNRNIQKFHFGFDPSDDHNLESCGFEYSHSTVHDELAKSSNRNIQKFHFGFDPSDDHNLESCGFEYSHSTAFIDVYLDTGRSELQLSNRWCVKRCENGKVEVFFRNCPISKTKKVVEYEEIRGEKVETELKKLGYSMESLVPFVELHVLRHYYQVNRGKLYVDYCKIGESVYTVGTFSLPRNEDAVGILKQIEKYSIKQPVRSKIVFYLSRFLPSEDFKCLDKVISPEEGEYVKLPFREDPFLKKDSFEGDIKHWMKNRHLDNYFSKFQGLKGGDFLSLSKSELTNKFNVPDTIAAQLMVMLKAEPGFVIRQRLKNLSKSSPTEEEIDDVLSWDFEWIQRFVDMSEEEFTDVQQKCLDQEAKIIKARME